MRNQRIVRDIAERPDTVGTFAPAPAKFYTPPARPKYSHATRASAGSSLEHGNVAELKIHLDGLPIQVRFSLDEASTKTLLGAIAAETTIRCFGVHWERSPTRFASRPRGELSRR